MLQHLRNRASIEVLGKAIRKYNVPESANQLLIDMGFIQPSMPGIFQYLPLGLRVQNKICDLLHISMRSLGASAISLAHLSSKEIWEKSGRWQKTGSELFRLHDRNDREMCLAPTHEEDVTRTMATIIDSQKQLPIRVYQIGRKFRDELRPRGGLLRGREFMMKDLYTFDIDKASAMKTYEDVLQAYHTFFKEVGLPFVMVKAATGNIGGNLSHEFHYRHPVGEDVIYTCPSCHYSTNSEMLDLSKTSSDISCPNCNDQLTSTTAIEVGHAFYLGKIYSSKFNATVEVKNKQEVLHMGCYGIGVSRLIAAVAHVTKDAKGLVWPSSIAPWKVLVVPTSDNHIQSAETVYDATANVVGFDNVLLEDRQNRAFGYKMRDAELIGYPFVIVVGSRFQEEGICEIIVRSSGERYKLDKDSLHQVLLGNFL
ncbi:mitochondrial proline-tRNA ligase [Schizosaccharomyces pombe]|uniref:Probable proline--tRNA ligase, mitochondrial n=1 Tax=Schizosaccharomyces pombe (strain 972 / ATCC 24843) TaxID=284812 RepID=SYPM_SCHPO|nr:putative proline--tRNA (Pro) ligase [Schizosaccharomyces pombe]O74765.1 RecName: Full=Probable proline--tRNA ligase, mitochondrial; AltName: Full=Prolyl-tRNA synthetase; Short=ProRS; Flags: Precursor [Schizosaccharomyces pombe 972h-]CAA21147.1 mitochondrial proline-tRNA ligase (predicted) [Schizosaccharomyces pombe]|eukprot:NP_595957.1 putative proline--tRNA (Pro) ligase [Schizosaccharomyces pombe]